MTKFNRKLAQIRPDGHFALRVTERKARGKQSARLLVRCGDCDERLEIYYDELGLELGGVHGSLANWREVLLPLLRPRRKRR